MGMSGEELAYKSRALAQSHPLTRLAKSLVDRCAEAERVSQPLPETGTWAAAAMVTGYCLRRVEEDEAGLQLTATDGADAGVVDLDALDQEALRIAADLRTEGAPQQIIGDEDSVISALDRIIASEVDRRIGNWKENVDQEAWAELEAYITWWAVKGYALRVAEKATGALA
ncbi:MAG TPA: hypothetical protein VK988_06070 [Acidimicrobiales bacterium]|jgi:hypothetical protein|nr:hypothetical protein [Acidimicrobiales bacterium]